MIKILGIGGEPATGKTTLVKRALDELRPLSPYRLASYRLLRFEQYKALRLVVLGEYPEGQIYGGTDRLSMAVQASAVDFLKNAIAAPQWDGVKILFEGDRLFNAGFIGAARSLLGERAAFWVLRANPLEVERRQKLRGANQSPAWLKGRRTKIANLVNEFQPVLKDNIDEAESMALSDEIVAWVKGENNLSFATAKEE